MTETSLEELVQERQFAGILQTHGEVFFRLSNTLLGLGKRTWNKKHYFQLISEADSLESFLDDYGARYNRTYSLLTERDATPVFFHESETLDISRTGVRALFRDPVAEGVLVQLCIRIPTLRNPILMVGKVRWCGPAHDEFHQAGIQFTGMFPEGLEEIIRGLNQPESQADASAAPGPF